MKILVDEMPKNICDCPFSKEGRAPHRKHNVWGCSFNKSADLKILPICSLDNTECKWFKQTEKEKEH